MLEFKIEPHTGIGPIKLGAKRAEIRAALSAIDIPLKFSKPALDYFFKNSIQVEYKGEDETAGFIGLASNKDYLVTYSGINVFDTPATRLFDLIAGHDNSGLHQFSQSQYCFPNQIITLWDADEQYDRLGYETRIIWGQVGLGDKRYLDSINKIKNRNT